LTRIQIRFNLPGALDEQLLERICAAQAIYGIEHIKVDPSLTAIEVEYDATRLRPPEVEAALRRCGLAVERA
jgi:hypothetical protein